VGFGPGEQYLVFDRFWRADPARARTTGGTGLGLAIALEDARLHRGWLQAWGERGKGSVFRLTLPRMLGQELAGSPLPLGPDEAEVVAGVGERLADRPGTGGAGFGLADAAGVPAGPAGVPAVPIDVPAAGEVRLAGAGSLAANGSPAAGNRSLVTGGGQVIDNGSQVIDNGSRASDGTPAADASAGGAGGRRAAGGATASGATASGATASGTTASGTTASGATASGTTASDGTANGATANSLGSNGAAARRPTPRAKSGGDG
jgi:two-component system sensor histidine kinase MtrB